MANFQPATEVRAKIMRIVTDSTPVEAPKDPDKCTIFALFKLLAAPAAVEALQAEGIAARGPLPADTLFHPAARATYDAVLCMYHDQALIPAKTLAFADGVNRYLETHPDQKQPWYWKVRRTSAVRPISSR